MHRALQSSLMATLVVLATAAPSFGGTFALRNSDPNVLYATYDAFPFEANDVTVTYDAGTGYLRLEDKGAITILSPLDDPIATRADCRYSRTTVECWRAGAVISAWITLGDRDDRATADADTVVVLAGDDGDDTLRVTDSFQSVQAGGRGDDSLAGGAGPSQLFGGPGADEISGGSGSDTVYYRHVFMSAYSTGWAAHDATAGIHLDLDGVADDGQPGEGDSVDGSIEGIVPTEFDDVITGDGGAQSIGGLGGDDTIDGGAGDDRLIGQEGSDDLTGGPGKDDVSGDFQVSGIPSGPSSDDVLSLDDGEADRYRCGPGHDTADVDALDVFGYPFEPTALLDCEA